MKERAHSRKSWLGSPLAVGESWLCKATPTSKQAELNPTLAHVHFASLIPPVPMEFLERHQTSLVEICHLCKTFVFNIIWCSAIYLFGTCCAVCGILSCLTGNWTCTPRSGSAESYPLDCQGNLGKALKKSNTLRNQMLSLSRNLRSDKQFQIPSENSPVQLWLNPVTTVMGKSSQCWSWFCAPLRESSQTTGKFWLYS